MDPNLLWVVVGFLVYLVLSAIFLYQDPTQERMSRPFFWSLIPAIILFFVVIVLPMIGISPFLTPMPADD